jgi:hypothetical protein
MVDLPENRRRYPTLRNWVSEDCGREIRSCKKLNNQTKITTT